MRTGSARLATIWIRSSAAQHSAMPIDRRGDLRPVLIILLLAAGALLATRLGGGIQQGEQVEASAAIATEPELHLQFGRNQLNIVATTASPAHETALRELLADQFARSHIETDFREGLLLPADWNTITTRLLYIVATTNSATVAANEQGISIRATTADLESYHARLEFLKDALSREDQVVSDVISISPDVSSQNLCARNFAAIAASNDATQQALRFRQSNTSLSEAAHAILDRLAEFAYDCQEAKIAILGFTDSTGSESWNVQVSERRAQAVAAQLALRGIASDRLLVEGRGSQSPLADNNTVQGRAQNRRIEFELR